MKMRSIVLSTLALGASAAVASQAHAGFIVAGFAATESIPTTGSFDKANITSNGSAVLRTQAFNVTEGVNLDSVSILADSPTGDSVTLWIADSLGAGANVFFNQTFDMTPDAGGIASWHNFDLSGTTLSEAGEYFLLIGSNGTQGLKIRRPGEAGSIELGDRSGAVVASGDSPFGATYASFAPGEVLGIQISGSAIPAPGAIALASLSGIVLVGRRKR